MLLLAQLHSCLALSMSQAVMLYIASGFCHEGCSSCPRVSSSFWLQRNSSTGRLYHLHWFAQSAVDTQCHVPRSSCNMQSLVGNGSHAAAKAHAGLLSWTIATLLLLQALISLQNACVQRTAGYCLQRTAGYCLTGSGSRLRWNVGRVWSASLSTL